VLAAAVDADHLRRALAHEGIPIAKVLPALAPVRFTHTTLEPPPPDRSARIIAAIVAAILMLMSLSMYGAAVANGVAQEKTTRTAEILLAAVRPGQLLVGKVAGIGLIGLGQLAIAAVAGIIANAVVHSASIPASVWALIPSFLAYFLLGFALYAFACATAGAMVARQEEVQFTMTPFSMLLVAGYVIVYAAVGSPDATWLRVVSLLPPFTASVMPVRIALGHVAAWEYPLSVLLMLVSIYGVGRLAARIYAPALVSGGARVSWRSVLRPRRP